MSAEPRLGSAADERARLAGSNKMDLLLFSLGGPETYGINVFKVREVCEAMPITQAPNMKRGVEGLVSMRGIIMPVISLATLLGAAHGHAAGPRKFIVTEFSGQVQAFLVHEVDRIVRVDWGNVRAPQPMLASLSAELTAITELPEGKLVSILDVEQLLSSVTGEPPMPSLQRIAGDCAGVFFADDSALARKKIAEVLDGLGVQHQHASNGREAWDRLQQLAAQPGALKTSVGLILVDAEMPEMDGYVLTRHVKADARFAGIPVVMHSSLSSVANTKLGQLAGVDAYVAKFHPDTLAGTIRSMLAAA